MTLVEFLLARIAEDEAVAREASVGSADWHLGDLSEEVLWWPPAPPEKVAFIRERMGDDVADRDASWSGMQIDSAGDQIAPHIARWDPARVLAECEAKRRIVGIYSHVRISESGAVLGGEGPEVYWETLKLLALPYADHADYDEGWRV